MAGFTPFLSSFSIYLKRHKELGYHQETNLNLIKYTRKLVRYLDQRTSLDLFFLKKEIERKGRIAEQSWLLEKIADAKKQQMDT